MTMIPHGCKRSEVGIIPVNWKVSTLGEGNARFTKGYGISKADLSEGGIPCVRYAELYTTYSDMSVLSTPASTTLPARARKFAQKGDVIFACSGETFEDIGRALAYIGDTPIAVGGDTLIYSNHNFEPSFLGYLLNSRYIVRQKMANSVGTTIVHIREKQLAELVVAYPEYEEQRAIATALADVDALIEAKRALLEKKRAIKQGTMQELLTGNRRLPGFPVTPMKNTELGDIPEDWEVKTLGRCASIARGGSPRPIESYLTTSPEGVNWIKIGDVSPGAKYIEHTEEKILPSGAKHSRKVKPGDLLLSNSMSYGRPYILSLEGCIHDGWLTIADYDSEFHKDYLYYALGSSIVVSQYEGLAAGTGVKNLNKKIVAGVQVPCPRDFDEQADIASVLSDMDDELVSLERELEKLVELKQGMMQNLLTGRIRLV